MGKIKDLNPHKGDIVRIKFKNINDIVTTSKHEFHEAEETYNIGDNFKAYAAGGDFIISEGYDAGEDEDYDDEVIRVTNHLDCNYGFTVYLHTIESIEIIQDSQRFESRDMKILIVRVDDEIFINGQPLMWNEEQAKKEHDRDQRNDRTNKPFVHPGKQLLGMFENYIADMALKESFNQGEE